MGDYLKKPGLAPDDLAGPAEKGAELLATIDELIVSPAYSPPSVHLLFAIYHYMGLPRAWQLSGLRELEGLAPERKAVLQRLAKEVLAGTDPREKYVFIFEPTPFISDEKIETLDLTDEKKIEESHWAWTMPLAFVEDLARLL